MLYSSGILNRLISSIKGWIFAKLSLNNNQNDNNRITREIFMQRVIGKWSLLMLSIIEYKGLGCMGGLTKEGYHLNSN